MELFEKRTFDDKINSYETNHFHMIIDGDMSLPIETLNDDMYSVFIHEYVHYIQHLTTLFGIKICSKYNGMFILYRDYFKNNPVIDIPLALYNKPCYQEINKFIDHFNKIKGTVEIAGCHARTIVVDTSEIEKAKNECRAVNMKISGQQNEKCALSFGYWCIIEGMAHMVQSLIKKDILCDDIPYKTVQLVCKNYCPAFAANIKLLVSICLCSLMYDNPGVGFFEVIDFAKGKNITDGLTLYKDFIKTTSIKYKNKFYTIDELALLFLDSYKVHLSAAISARLQYYNKVIDKCKKDFLLGQNSFLNALYSDVLVDKHKFNEIANVYGYPLIEGDNNIIMPGGNHPYKETAYMIGFELIIKRIESTGVNSVCGWYKKQCSKGITRMVVKLHMIVGKSSGTNRRIAL